MASAGAVIGEDIALRDRHFGGSGSGEGPADTGDRHRDPAAVATGTGRLRTGGKRGRNPPLRSVHGLTKTPRRNAYPETAADAG